MQLGLQQRNWLHLELGSDFYLFAFQFSFFFWFSNDAFVCCLG